MAIGIMIMPITDGVASSVLESLALGTPVVASENGTRPPHVVTYEATNPDALAAAVEHALRNRAAIVERMGALEIRDTLTEEATLLTSGGRDTAP